MALQIIGLSGKAGVGKDYIAQQFLQPLGFQQISLADHFKLTIVGRKLATFQEVFHTKPPHVRKLLQEEGTERGRNVYGEDVWCDTLYATVLLHAARNNQTRWVIPDVRFPNEVQFIQQVGGVVYRIWAPDRAATSPLTPEQRQHPSETALDRYDPIELPDGTFDFGERFFDALIDNRVFRNDSLDLQLTHALRVHDILAPNQSFERGTGVIDLGPMLIFVPERDVARVYSD